MTSHNVAQLHRSNAASYGNQYAQTLRSHGVLYLVDHIYQQQHYECPSLLIHWARIITLARPRQTAID